MAWDVKKYWQEIAQKAGLPPEEVQAVEAILGKDTVSKAMVDSFVPMPDYSRNLGELNGKVKTAEERANAYQDWYNKQAQPVVEQLAKYKETYGELDGKPTL